jgi:thiol-disulfide isomerase/thioredoxin
MEENYIIYLVTATWCKSCKNIDHDIFENFNVKYFTLNDSEEDQLICNKLKITKFPTIIILKDNKEVGRLMTANNSLIYKFISRHINDKNFV